MRTQNIQHFSLIDSAWSDVISGAPYKPRSQCLNKKTEPQGRVSSKIRSEGLRFGKHRMWFRSLASPFTVLPIRRQARFGQIGAFYVPNKRLTTEHLQVHPGDGLGFGLQRASTTGTGQIQRRA